MDMLDPWAHNWSADLLLTVVVLYLFRPARQVKYEAQPQVIRGVVLVHLGD